MPLNCDVSTESPGNLVKNAVLMQEVWGGAWDSGFLVSLPGDISVVVQGPHCEQQHHTHPSTTFLLSATHSKCPDFTKHLIHVGYHAGSWGCSHGQADPRLLAHGGLHCGGKRQKIYMGKWTNKYYIIRYRLGSTGEIVTGNGVLWPSSKLLGHWSLSRTNCC